MSGQGGWGGSSCVHEVLKIRLFPSKVFKIHFDNFQENNIWSGKWHHLHSFFFILYCFQSEAFVLWWVTKWSFVLYCASVWCFCFVLSLKVKLLLNCVSEWCFVLFYICQSEAFVLYWDAEWRCVLYYGSLNNQCILKRHSPEAR